MNHYQLFGYTRQLCAVAVGVCVVSAASADTIDLIHEFDGNSNGLVSYGTIDLVQNGLLVDVTITANTGNLGGGDIHEWYFNLPGAVDLNTLAISGEGGTSSHAIGTFSPLVNPSVTGGAGSSFDAGVSFGNGGGPPGNGTLTVATFSITATGGLLVSDFLSELSASNNAPDVYAAVHFQSTSVFSPADSETVGGVPEPTSLALLSLGGLLLTRRRR